MVDKGDVAWMFISTVLVMLMIVPGLALFYGGLVRAKNILSVLMQVLVVASLALVLWVAYGYSLAFDGGNAWIGGFGKAMLSGVGPASTVATFTQGVVHSRTGLRRVPGRVRGDQLRAGGRRDRRTREVRGGAVVRGVVVHLRLSAARAHGVGRQRIPLQARCARFRGRHRRAHQCRRRGPGRCVHARAAHRVRSRALVAAQPAADVRRRVVAVGRLVRIQRGFGAGSQRRRRARIRQHACSPPRPRCWCGARSKRCCAGVRRCWARRRVRSRGSSRSRRRAAPSASAVRW